MIQQNINVAIYPSMLCIQVCQISVPAKPIRFMYWLRTD